MSGDHVEITARQHRWHPSHPPHVESDEVFCKDCFHPARISGVYVDPSDNYLKRKIIPFREGGEVTPICPGPPT